MEEQWQKDVQNTINKARSQVAVDPDEAEAMIQQKTSDLTAVTELRPEMRDRLMGMLRTREPGNQASQGGVHLPRAAAHPAKRWPAAKRK